MSSHRRLLAIKFSGRPAADLKNFGLESSAEFFSAKLVSYFPELYSGIRKPPPKRGHLLVGLVVLVYPFYDFFHSVRATGYR
jgi:hypothetical protein